jgi:dihydroxy-acid dehydratase
MGLAVAEQKKNDPVAARQPPLPPSLHQVGISSVWYEGNPCNMHLMDLAAEVKAGVEDAGMVGYRFNTIGVSDGISMGTDGMSFSLQSRDLIADSIETVMGAQW